MFVLVSLYLYSIFYTELSITNLEVLFFLLSVCLFLSGWTTPYICILLLSMVLLCDICVFSLIIFNWREFATIYCLIILLIVFIPGWAILGSFLLFRNCVPVILLRNFIGDVIFHIRLFCLYYVCVHHFIDVILFNVSPAFFIFISCCVHYNRDAISTKILHNHIRLSSLSIIDFLY